MELLLSGCKKGDEFFPNKEKTIYKTVVSFL